MCHIFHTFSHISQKSEFLVNTQLYFLSFVFGSILLLVLENSLILLKKKNIILAHQTCDWNAGPVRIHGKLF